MTTSSDSDALTIRNGTQPSNPGKSEVSNQETATRQPSPKDGRSFEAVLENELKRIFSVLKEAAQKEVERLYDRKVHSGDQQEQMESEDQTETLRNRLSDLQAKHERTLAKTKDLEAENQQLKAKVEELDALRTKDSILRLDSEEMHRKIQKESLCWMLFGDLSRSDDSIRSMADRVLRATQNNEPGAIGLGARMMAIRASTPEEAPNLLKEIGEAFYRWQPRDHGPPTSTESALVDYLNSIIASLGLKNSIELVQAGDRYDSARHFSSDRGVEVSAVRGWLVLRENGKPVTKASVILR